MAGRATRSRACANGAVAYEDVDIRAQRSQDDCSAVTDEAHLRYGISRVPTGRLDLSKLKVIALRKYRSFYELTDVPASSTKEDLFMAVSEHFHTQEVHEQEVLSNLARKKAQLSGPRRR